MPEEMALGLAIAIYTFCLLGWMLDLVFWASSSMLHIFMSISGAGMRVSGTGIRGTSPNPLDPMGMEFSPLVFPWGAKLSHPRSPVEEFPAGNRVSGPHCHLESRDGDGRQRGEEGAQPTCRGAERLELGGGNARPTRRGSDDCGCGRSLAQAASSPSVICVQHSYSAGTAHMELHRKRNSARG